MNKYGVLYKYIDLLSSVTFGQWVIDSLSDGYLMLNIYPMRATKIKSDFPCTCDDKVCEMNYKYIKERIPKEAEIIAAWGTHICDRDYFISALKEINNIVKQRKSKWICLSKTKFGHPHHPTRLAYEKMTFEEFDMDDYLKNMLRGQKNDKGTDARSDFSWNEVGNSNER